MISIGYMTSGHYAEAIALLRRSEALALAMNPEEGILVMFSGGKDSQVIYELCKQAGVKFTAYYIVTGNDAPENVYFIRKYYPDVRFAHPREKYFKLIEKKGLPTLNRRFCCERIKEHVGAGSLVVTGVRAEESKKRAEYSEVMVRSRRKEWERRGPHADLAEMALQEHKCIKGKDKVMVYPILHWSENEVWAFIDNNHIPRNPLYQSVGRVGCMFCPFSSAKQMEWYERQYPLFLCALMHHLQRFWDKTDDHVFNAPQEYYRWWKTKQSVRKYQESLRQQALVFPDMRVPSDAP